MRPQAPKIKESSEFRNNINMPSVSSPRPHTVLALTEARLTEIAKSLGLNGWIVFWEPDETQPRGQIKPDNMVILIHDGEQEDAVRSLLHEVLEIKLRPMLKPYRGLVNALVEWADKQVYEAKEQAIEDLLPIFVKFVEDRVEGPSPRELEELAG